MTAVAARRGPSPTRVGLLLGYVAGTSGLGLAAAPIVSRQLADELGLATAQTVWVLALFSLALAVTTPVFGRYADLHGGRRSVGIGVCCSLAGTGLVLVAPTLPVLLAGRFLQGAAAAALSIVAFAIPAHLLEGSDRAKALGVLTALSALMLGAGPLFGAAAASLTGWRAALVLSVLMLLAVPALARLAAPPLAGARSTLDLTGAGLVLTAGAGGSVLLQARTTHLEPVSVVAIALVTAAAALALVRHVRRTPEGFLPIVVVRNRVFVCLSLAAGALMGGFLAMGFLAPLLLTEDASRSSLAVGVILLPAALAAAATAHVVGVLRATVSAERILVGLGVVAVGGILAAGFGGNIPALVVVGAAAATSGFAGAQVALLDRLADLVPAADRGIAIGVFNLVFVTGGATGAAFAGAVVDVASLSAATVACGLFAALSIPAARAAARAGR
ncbi:MAG: MFS transporter [Solirubrobacteraceae bacterium]